MNLVEKVRKYMIDNCSNHLGPDFTNKREDLDPEANVAVALSILILPTKRKKILGIDETPNKKYCKLVLSNINEYFRQLLGQEIVVREFDNIYNDLISKSAVLKESD